MKFFAVFAAIVAVATATSTTWTIPELSAALQNPNTDPFLVPLIEEALNEAMVAAYAGSPEPTATVSSVVQDFTLWTLPELSEALQDPATDPALIPYLEHALDSMMDSLMAGEQPEYVIVGTPVGLLPVETVAPVAVVNPVVVAPVEAPVSSPLVQIIVNVKSQQSQQVPVETVPAVPDIPSVMPGPAVNPIDVIAIAAPEINPVDVIAIAAPEINPVDVIAISAPEINPVDLLAPVPVVAPVAAGTVVGPIA